MLEVVVPKLPLSYLDMGGSLVSSMPSVDRHDRGTSWVHRVTTTMGGGWNFSFGVTRVLGVYRPGYLYLLARLWLNVGPIIPTGAHTAITPAEIPVPGGGYSPLRIRL